MGISEATKARLGVIALVVTGLGIGWLAGLSVSPVVSIVITSITGAAGAVVAALSGLKEDAATTDETPKPKEPLRRRIDPIPIGLLAAGLILGSIFGLLARNYHLLGSDLSAELTKWERAGLAKTEVARRLFELQYPYTPYARGESLLGQDLQAEYTQWLSATTAITNTTTFTLANEITRRLLDLHYPPAAYLTTLTQASATTTPTQYIRGTGLLGSGAATTTSADCADLRGKRGAALQDQLEKTQWQALPAIITDTAKLKTIVDEVLCQEAS